MKCKICGGTLNIKNGVAVCESCNATCKIDSVFENVDVHICYIESDPNGRRTKDSIIAQELYQKLEAKKIHAFYERISATTVVGDDLQQLRYSSLNAAKVVLVVGTNAENFSTILEKYGQYLIDKVVIPFCLDVKLSDIPRELSKIQALDYSSIGWEKDLEKSILHVLGREKEIDLQEARNKSKRNQGILIGLIIAVILIAVAFLVFLHFNKSKEPQDSVPQTNQQMYENAQNLANAGSYLEALDLYLSILDYKDTQKQIKSIFDRYDGYYQTPDKQFSIYFNIIDALELSLEMTTVSSNGTAEATVSGIWEGKEKSYSFTDSFGNFGKVTAVLTNDAILITVKMESVGNFASIGNQNVEFKLSDKTDKPEILQVTSELLLAWLQTPTTTDDITSLGFKLEKDSTSEITAGGGTLNDATLYRIASTDIELFFYAKDLSNQDVLYDYGNGSDKQIVCAAFADAEYLIPDKINSECQMSVKNDILFVPGGKSMNIDWGGEDINILFFTDEYFEYSPSGTIKADTKVGAFCRKIVGNGFFVRSVLMHNSLLNGIYKDYGPLIAEKNDAYIILDDNRSGRAYNVDKKTYEIVEVIDVLEFFVRSESYNVYSQPSYESDIVKSLPEGWCYSIETKEDQDDKLWGKLIDEQGWICLTDIPTED